PRHTSAQCLRSPSVLAVSTGQVSQPLPGPHPENPAFPLRPCVSAGEDSAHSSTMLKSSSAHNGTRQQAHSPVEPFRRYHYARTDGTGSVAGSGRKTHRISHPRGETGAHATGGRGRRHYLATSTVRTHPLHCAKPREEPRTRSRRRPRV